MTMRIEPKAVAFLLLLLGSSALAVDASCVGVQEVEAHQQYDALSAADQQQFQPVINAIDELQKQTSTELAEPEAQLKQAISDVLGFDPDTAEPQAWTKFYEQLPNSVRLDQAYADNLRAQFRVHWYEAQMMALTARLPRADSASRVAALTDDFQRTHSAVDASEGAGDTNAGRQLTGLAAIAQRLSGISMTDPASRDLSADSDWLAHGFDTGGLSGDDIGPFKQAARAVSAATAVGSAAVLEIGHLSQDLPAAAPRREIMEKGATETGRRAAEGAAISLSRYSEAHVVQDRIARIVPPPPPAATPKENRAAMFRAAVAERVKEASRVIKTLPQKFVLDPN